MPAVSGRDAAALRPSDEEQKKRSSGSAARAGRIVRERESAPAGKLGNLEHASAMCAVAHAAARRKCPCRTVPRFADEVRHSADRGATASHRVTGNPAILLTRPHGTARHSQLPKRDVAGSIPVARSDGLELRDTRRFDRLPSANCPCSVRESLPTSPKPDQPGARRLSISYGASWEGLVPVAPAVALITQRSLVQIQPPQPTYCKTASWPSRRPFSFARPRISARRSRPTDGSGVRVSSPSRCLASSAFAWTGSRRSRSSRRLSRARIHV
jgi:hypothetical protein